MLSKRIAGRAGPFQALLGCVAEGRTAAEEGTLKGL